MPYPGYYHHDYRFGPGYYNHHPYYRGYKNFGEVPDWEYYAYHQARLASPRRTKAAKAKEYEKLKTGFTYKYQGGPQIEELPTEPYKPKP